MTTNKPEVMAYFISHKYKWGTRRVGVRLLENHDPSSRHENWNYEPLVRLSDYEALQAECDVLRKAAEVSAADANDAERDREYAELYRTLRAMHWHSSPLAVVRNPKVAIKPGHDCPSGDRLDEILKEYHQ